MPAPLDVHYNHHFLDRILHVAKKYENGRYFKVLDLRIENGFNAVREQYKC